MGLLRIIVILLLIFIIGICIHRYRHWIDKKLQTTWTALLLLIGLIVVFLGVSYIFEFLFSGNGPELDNLLRIYGMFSQTLSAYTPEEDQPIPDSMDYVYHLLLSVIGAFLFAGILISAFNNVLVQRIQKVKDGLVDYDFSGHVVIIGVNDSLLTILRTITNKKNYKNWRIIIVTSKCYDDISPLRGDVGTKIWNNIYYIKDDILDPVYRNSDLSHHFFKRVGIANCREIYILGDSPVSKCDVDNSRIVTSLYNYFKYTQSNVSAPVNCYMEYSNLAMTIRVCRRLEGVKTGDCIPVHKYIRVFPFDPNMILAAKAWKVDIPKVVDIVGFTDIGVAMTKYLLLADHDPKGTLRQINVYLTHQEIETKHLFEISYDYESIPDIRLEFIEIDDYTDYVRKAMVKAPAVVLCGMSLEKNITITYALQHNAVTQKIFVNSSTPILSGVFSNIKGGENDYVKPFGNHNQRIELDKLLQQSMFMFKLYKHILKDIEMEDIKDECYFEYGFDKIKWMLMALMVILKKKRKWTPEAIGNQQLAATVLSGYRIGEKTKYSRFIVSRDNLDDMFQTFEKASQYIPMVNLHKYNLYPVTGNAEQRYLYAPLCGTVAEVSEDELTKIDEKLRKGVIPEEIAAMVRDRLSSVELTPETTPDLMVLINQRCNFSCRYCYSANGRSNAELPEELFEPLVRWFVDPAKRGSDLNVSFSGGGDPTLSMPKIRSLVNMMRARGRSTGARITFGMVCNGSHIREEDVEFIRENFSNLVISFDVIPEVHDTQRSHYQTVAGTMRSLIRAGVKFGLRSTITELNVDRMEEMVEVLHRDFPDCRSLAMEAVLAPDMWEDTPDLESFHSRFVKKYFKAQQLADKYGISLGNTIELSADGLKSRACEGKVVVTPDGRLTACSRIATEGDNFFQDFVFGKITEDGVVYDCDKYQEIMQVRADNIEECHECFARYHCGGGCLLARLAYTPEMMDAHCNFTRQILKHKIFNELD